MVHYTSENKVSGNFQRFLRLKFMNVHLFTSVITSNVTCLHYISLDYRILRNFSVDDPRHEKRALRVFLINILNFYLPNNIMQINL